MTCIKKRILLCQEQRKTILPFPQTQNSRSISRPPSPKIFMEMVDGTGHTLQTTYKVHHLLMRPTDCMLPQWWKTLDCLHTKKRKTYTCLGARIILLTLTMKVIERKSCFSNPLYCQHQVIDLRQAIGWTLQTLTNYIK